MTTSSAIGTWWVTLSVFILTQYENVFIVACFPKVQKNSESPYPEKKKKKKKEKDVHKSRLFSWKPFVLLIKRYEKTFWHLVYEANITNDWSQLLHFFLLGLARISSYKRSEIHFLCL